MKRKPGQTVNVGSLTLQLNGQAVAFAPPASLGELKEGCSSQTGDLFKTWNLNAGANPLDPGKVEDILLLLKYYVVQAGTGRFLHFLTRIIKAF